MFHKKLLTHSLIYVLMTAYTQLKTTLTILTIITIYLNFLSIAKDSPVSTVLSWHHYLTLLYHATLVFEMAFGILATQKKCWFIVGVYCWQNNSSVLQKAAVFGSVLKN